MILSIIIPLLPLCYLVFRLISQFSQNSYYKQMTKKIARRHTKLYIKHCGFIFTPCVNMNVGRPTKHCITKKNSTHIAYIWHFRVLFKHNNFFFYINYNNENKINNNPQLFGVRKMKIIIIIQKHYVIKKKYKSQQIVPCAQVTNVHLQAHNHSGHHQEDEE